MEKNFGKKFLITITIIIFIILLISMQSSINSNKQSINELLNPAADIIEIKTQIQNMNIQLNDFDTRITDTRYMLADAWFAIHKDIQSDIDNFYIDNVKFNKCNKVETDVRVMKNWYNNNDIKPFNHVVIYYEDGSIVFYENGTVKCFPSVINEMNPPNISCDELCKQ